MANNQITITVNPEIYPLSVIYKTAYVFIDKTYIFLDKKNKEIIIQLTPKEENKDLKKIKGEFLNELLNYSLREELNRENKKIRELIIQKALYSSVSEKDIWLDEE